MRDARAVCRRSTFLRGKKKSEKRQNVWLKTKVRKVQKTEPWWMYILKKCRNSADCAIPLWCWVELEG